MSGWNSMLIITVVQNFVGMKLGEKKIGTIRLEHGTQYKHQESSIYF